MGSHKYIVRFALILIFLFVYLGFQSCSLKQSIYIDRTGAGRVNFDLELAPYFVDVTEQLSELSPENDTGKIKSPDGKKVLFDLVKIRKDFSKRKGTVLKELNSPSPNKLTGILTFNDISAALGGASGNNVDIFSFSSKNNITTLMVNLNYDTVGQFLDSNPSMNSPLMESFGPMANKGLTDNEYLEMMQFALGDESKSGIIASNLILDINVAGTITAQKGGTVLDDNSVQFKIPLLKVLLLDKPQSFSVSFRE